VTFPARAVYNGRMRRREFFGSLALGATAATMTARAAAQTSPGKNAPKSGKPEFYELRAYHLRVGPQVKPMHDFLGEVYVPLLNQLGVRPVGAFQLTFGPNMPTLYLLSPYASLADYERVTTRLADELPRHKSPSAQAFFSATGQQPPYTRVETQLLRAFDGIPRLELPPTTAKRQPRIFELRVYETPSELGQSRKIEMFGPRMGELAIFRRVGLRPVLFARSVVGPRQPSFSYLLAFADLAEREAAWQRFRDDPEWQKLKVTPGYTDADIMSNIHDLILTPTPYSQI
jgi:hypothetical protein